MTVNNNERFGEVVSSRYAAQFARTGFEIFRKALPQSAIDAAREAIDRIPAGDAVRKRKSVYGVRNLLELSDPVCKLATGPDVWQFVTPILGNSGFATRAIFFNKTPDTNWALGWHQDSVISVAKKRDTAGFRAWGQKAGVWQVQPSAEVLSGMLALRIHLDDCPADNGALRVIPGSHSHGWLDDEIAEWKRRVSEVTCSVPSGGIVAMCPMILHASSRSTIPGQRRVIHIEYANCALPNGLKWNRRIRPGGAKSSGNQSAMHSHG